MPVMNSSSQSSIETASRRFLLLPEDGVESSSRRPPVRRYRLTSIGRRGAPTGADLATARLVSEIGRLGRGRG